MVLREIMSTPVEVISSDSSIKSVAEVFIHNMVGSLVVVDQTEGGPFRVGDGRKAVGMVTRMDVIDAVATSDKHPRDINVRKFMSKPLITTKPHEGIGEVVMMMGRNRVKHILIEGDGKLIGIVTATKIVRHSIDFAGELLDERYREILSGAIGVG